MFGRSRLLQASIVIAIILLAAGAAQAQLSRDSRIPGSGAMGLRLHVGGAVNITADPDNADISVVRGAAIGASPLFGNAFVEFAHRVDTTASPNTIEGTFTITAGNGDTVTGVYRGVATERGPNGFAHFAAEWRITAGTGRYAELTGRGLLAATIRTRDAGNGLATLEFFSPISRLAR